MSAFEPMSKTDQNWFNNHFKGNKKPHKGNWTLFYGTLTWPESTDAPRGVCENKKKELMRDAQYPNKSKFKLKPAN